MKIQVCGVISSQMGYSNLTREFIALLHKNKMDVQVQAIELDRAEISYGPKHKVCLDLAARPRVKPDVNIIIMIPRLFKQFRVEGAKNIGFTMFESDGLPDGWKDDCNAMDGIIVPSRFNEESFRRAGVIVPIYVIPPSINEDIAYVEKYDSQAQPAEYKFYSIFQWSERKNPEGLIRAFNSAFSGDTDVSLTIKTYGANKANPTAIANEIKSITSKIKLKYYPKLYTEFCLLSNSQVQQIHEKCDCYVSSSRGEGWNLPAFDAALNSNMVITTGWSAITEFLPVDYPGLVKYNLVPPYNIGTFAPFYNAEKMMWAEPHLDDMMAKMRWAYENREAAREVGVKHRSTLLANYAEKPIFELISATLDKIIS